jgi:hypothetical protein
MALSQNRLCSRGQNRAPCGPVRSPDEHLAEFADIVGVSSCHKEFPLQDNCHRITGLHRRCGFDLIRPTMFFAA